MSEFRAVSLDGEVTLTSPNGKFVFPSHRKYEVRTYKITFTDDVGNSGFTYYAQAPFVGTDLSLSAGVYAIRGVEGLPAVFTYHLGYNTTTRLIELQPGAIVNVGITIQGGSDVIPDDINENVLWITDKNGNRVGGSPNVVAYADPWGTTTIAGATFNLNGQPSMPYENYTTEQKNNATYTLHIKTTPTTEYTRQFFLVDGQDYIKCFQASTDSPCSWETPCCVDEYNMTQYDYFEVSCPDPRVEGGVRTVQSRSQEYGNNCITIAADGLTETYAHNYINFNMVLMTPVGTQDVTLYGGAGESHITYYGTRYEPMTFGVYKSDSSGNIINNNPIYTWTQNLRIEDGCSEEIHGCTNYDRHLVYVGPGYVSGEQSFRNALKSNFAGSDEYYVVMSGVGVTPSQKSLPLKIKKVNPCAGLDTSTRDKYKIKLTASDKVYSQRGSQYNIYTYNSTSNGLVNISSGSSSYNISYSTFTASYGGYAIFDDDGSGRPATTTDRQNITVNVGDTTNYSGDNFAEAYIITRIQTNGTVTICQQDLLRQDNPPMITTTGSEIGSY
jgi:hypothetical protein